MEVNNRRALISLSLSLSCQSGARALSQRTALHCERVCEIAHAQANIRYCNCSQPAIKRASGRAGGRVARARNTQCAAHKISNWLSQAAMSDN